MLGFRQAPVLAAGAQYGFQALVQALLVTLQLGHQTPPVFQLIGRGQLFQAFAQALFAELETLGLIPQGLQLTELLLVIGLQVAHLPDPPATNGDARRPQQQGQNCQPVATTLNGWFRGFSRCLGHRLGFIFRQGCFAHVSILCV